MSLDTDPVSGASQGPKALNEIAALTIAGKPASPRTASRSHATTPSAVR